MNRRIFSMVIMHRERRIYWNPCICAARPSRTEVAKDKDMIQFGKDESHIEVKVEKRGITYQIDMHLKKNKAKGIAINRIPIKKASELFGILNVVFFSPEDLNIIKNGPAERRRFIDLELSQLDKVYLNDLGNYNRIINQRNKLLKDISFNSGLKDTLDIWDIQLIEYGEKDDSEQEKSLCPISTRLFLRFIKN